jgi:hypothetical protein
MEFEVKFNGYYFLKILEAGLNHLSLSSARFYQRLEGTLSAVFPN